MKTSEAIPRRRRRLTLGPWLIVPALLLLAIFVFRPLFRAVQLSFFGSDLFGNPSRFVGFDNYLEFFTDPASARVLLVTLVIAVSSMVMSVGMALFAVILLRQWLPGSGVLRVVFSLPFAYSAAAASAVFSGMFAPSVGVVNQILSSMGVSGPPWLEDPVWATFTIAVTTSWYEVGFAFLVLTAAMRSIPPEVLEAASLDGAGGTRMAWSMLVPLMSPSLFFLFVTQTISGLQTFTQVQILTQGGPANSTRTLVFELYRTAFGEGTPDFGRASVLAVVLVLIVALITWLQFRFINRRVTA